MFKTIVAPFVIKRFNNELFNKVNIKMYTSLIGVVPSLSPYFTEEKTRAQAKT